MKIIIDLFYHGNLIDAHCVQVLKPKGQVATLKLDLTNTIDNQIKIKAYPQKIVTAQRKELDKHENHHRHSVQPSHH